jgi:hypothetical protein
MSSRRFMFVQPHKNWPRPPAKYLSMEVLKEEKGIKTFTFRKSAEYQSLMKEFRQVQATMDIS